VFGSPPWDHLAVVDQALPELRRVLQPEGRLILVLPCPQDRQQAVLTVTDRNLADITTYLIEAPRERRGPRYYSPTDSRVFRILNRYPARRLLDPFCGVGTIPRVARQLGITAVGCDIAL
jgi:hypothetical protein